MKFNLEFIDFLVIIFYMQIYLHSAIDEGIAYICDCIAPGHNPGVSPMPRGLTPKPHCPRDTPG